MVIFAIEIGRNPAGAGCAWLLFLADKYRSKTESCIARALRERLVSWQGYRPKLYDLSIRNKFKRLILTDW